ncbi:mitochondrial import inner membrane translocase subunit TIM23 [Entomortierella parvispora]|uniref:Presequence translocated-associated motor subunit PAM17 n=1 Tax=Entomortierella parvispora TaxID=205924 RepID=A0A9P3H1R3_9FUNG|nr:mitochondrial import inner membrane translocase subunit TIM23 [Entomortierella parvispora]
MTGPTTTASSTFFSRNNTAVPLFTKSMSSTAVTRSSASPSLWPSSEGGTGAPSSFSRFEPTGTRVQQGHNDGYQTTMDWNTYFALRRTRRRYESMFMVPCGLLGFSGAGAYFLMQPFDPTPIFGFDQLLVYGVGTLAAGLLGVAIGPVMGNTAFRALHHRARPLVDKMDKEFHKHIVKHRVDPTRNSGRNVVPDYYGEKIKSISDYRNWLRKQHNFRRKADGRK